MVIVLVTDAVNPLVLSLGRPIGYPKAQTIPLLPDSGKCSMDPSMDSVRLTSLDCQSTDQTTVSLTERKSFF